MEEWKISNDQLGCKLDSQTIFQALSHYEIFRKSFHSVEITETRNFSRLRRLNSNFFVYG